MRRGSLELALAIVVLSAGAASAKQGVSLEQAYQAIHARKFVDLTHSFAPGIPHYEALPDEKVERMFDIARDGFTVQVFSHVGQWGTHVDPPAHFHEGLKTLDQIDPHQFLLRLAVIDVHAKVAKNPDYILTLGDVRDWEKRHGRIPAGSFVAMRTDWSKRWPDAAKMDNKDAAGIAHYPGWGMDVLKFLHEQRGVAVIGHETTDPTQGVAGSKGDMSHETYWLGLDKFQIELLTNLDQLPEAGALVMVSFPKPEKGLGFPARVVAILP